MLSLEVEVDLGVLGYTEVSVYFSTHTDSEPYSIGENDYEREYTVVDVEDVKLLGVSVVHLIDDCELTCISESVLEMLEGE